MAYQEEAPVNWCPELKAVLSHEEVADGVSVEGEHPVYQKKFTAVETQNYSLCRSSFKGFGRIGLARAY